MNFCAMDGMDSDCGPILPLEREPKMCARNPRKRVQGSRKRPKRRRLQRSPDIQSRAKTSDNTIIKVDTYEEFRRKRAIAYPSTWYSYPARPRGNLASQRPSSHVFS